jgi:hypothetical protein
MAADPGVPIAATEGLTIDSCALDLPTLFDKAFRLPVVTAAFAKPSGRIICYRCTFERRSAKDAAAVLRQLIEAEQSLVAFEIALVAAPGFEWRLLAEMLRDCGVGTEERLKMASREFRRLVGETLGGVRLAQKRTIDPVVDPSSAVKPLAEATALEIIAEAVFTHNSKRTKHSVPQSTNSVPGLRRLCALLEWYLIMPDQSE